MKLDNRDLVLRGILDILPRHLEPFTRQVLGGRLTPEGLCSPALEGDPAPDVPDVAELSTQLRVLTARGRDGAPPAELPEGLAEALEEVGRIRGLVVEDGDIDTATAEHALATAARALRMVGAEHGGGDLEALIGALDGGRGPGRNPLDAVAVDVRCAGTISYAHAVAGLSPRVSIRLSLAGADADDHEEDSNRWAQEAPAGRPAAEVERLGLHSSAAVGAGGGELGAVEVSVTLIEDDGGAAICEPWTLSWDTREPQLPPPGR